jgi:hypothetical protein
MEAASVAAFFYNFFNSPYAGSIPALLKWDLIHHPYNEFVRLGNIQRGSGSVGDA